MMPSNQMGGGGWGRMQNRNMPGSWGATADSAPSRSMQPGPAQREPQADTLASSSPGFQPGPSQPSPSRQWAPATFPTSSVPQPSSWGGAMQRPQPGAWGGAAGGEMPQRGASPMGGPALGGPPQDPRMAMMMRMGQQGQYGGMQGQMPPPQSGPIYGGMQGQMAAQQGQYSGMQGGAPPMGGPALGGLPQDPRMGQLGQYSGMQGQMQPPPPQYGGMQGGGPPMGGGYGGMQDPQRAMMDRLRMPQQMNGPPAVQMNNGPAQQLQRFTGQQYGS